MNSKWIKCSDRMPKKDGTIYIGFKNGDMFFFNYAMGDWHEISKSEIAYEIEFSHWMPFPKPPEDL